MIKLYSAILTWILVNNISVVTFIHYLKRKSIYQNYTSDVGLITFMKLNLLQIQLKLTCVFNFLKVPQLCSDRSNKHQI